MQSEKQEIAFVDSRRALPLEPFDDHYDLLVGVLYGLRDPQPKLRDIGSRDNRKCAFCDKSEPETTFKLDAHLIPECLGNRHYVSNEECDVCNQKHGSLYESELARMLHLERAIQRVRTKDGGTAKLKSNSGNSYVGGGSFDAPLQIFYDKQDTFLRFEYIGDGAKLTATAPSFRPIQALKSVLKSFWLSIDAETRMLFGFVKAFVNDEIYISPTEFFHYFQPEAGDVVVLESWKRKSTSKLLTSDLIVRLTFGHFVILWCSPDAKTLQHHPSLLPPPLFPPAQAGNIATTLYLVQNSEAQIPAREVSYTISIGSRTQTNEPMDVSSQNLISVPERKRKERPIVRVKAEIITDDENACIGETYMTLFRTDDRNDRYLLQGGAAAASITFHEDRLTNKTSFAIKNQLHLNNAIDGHATMKFLRMLFSGGNFKLTEIDTGLVLRDFPFRDGRSLINYRDYEKFLEFIISINKKFGLDLRVPNPPCSLPLPLAGWIFYGKEHGSVERFPKEPDNYTVFVSEAKKILNSLRTGEEVVFEHPNFMIELMGAKINLGLIKSTLVSPRLIGSLEDKEKELSKLANEDEVELTILSDSVVDRFTQ